MWKALAMMAALALAACDAVPQATPRTPVVVGQTSSGQDMLRFRLTRTNALGVTPVSNAAITARAAQICPGGYRELSRSGEATRRISGVIYTDIDVTIVCG